MAEIDDFWDIASLLPRKKRQTPPAASTLPSQKEAEKPSSSITPEGTYSVSFSDEKEGAADSSDKARRALPQADKKTSLLLEYAPKGHPFLKRVRVYEQTSPFHFYHGFREAAAESLSHLGDAKEAPFVPFFSYSPQYSQLSPEQRAYYLYFRDSVYRGEYIKADKNYILLLVYEILNAPEKSNSEEGVLFLAKVFAAYRAAFPQMNRYMPEWLIDYCLLYRVSLPVYVLAPFYNEILAENVLREFYLGALAESSAEESGPLISYLSRHDPYKSRFANREDVLSELFHIEKAVSLVFSHINARAALEKNLITTKEREAFCGAVFAGASRYRIELVYQPIFASVGLSEQITAAVKYAENRLRMHFHVKSRLMVRELDETVKDVIDSYFDSALPEEPKALASRPEYERQYDAPTASFSASEAEKIENDSWQNTWLLVEEEQAASEEPVLPPEQAAPSLTAPVSKEALLLLGALFHGRPVPALFGKAAVLAEEINGYFSDTLGDVVLDVTDGGLVPIFDYQEEVEDFLKSYTDNE